MKRPQLPEVIKTTRLVLRPHRLGDVESVLSYATDQEWARYLPVPCPYLRSDAEQFLARQILLDRSEHPTWAIVLGESVVGGMNIRFDFDNRLGEIGYSVARMLWGQGLGTEAARAVVNAAFQTHSDLNRIRAMADTRNLASQRVMEKIGMTKEGVLRQNRIARGEPVDEVWFGILRCEWGE